MIHLNDCYIEVVVSADRKTVWVNDEEKCQLRVCGVKELRIGDARVLPFQLINSSGTSTYHKSCEATWQFVRENIHPEPYVRPMGLVDCIYDKEGGELLAVLVAWN